MNTGVIVIQPAAEVQVIFADPVLTPNTTPEVKPTVAMPVFDDVHVTVPGADKIVV
jgi:hypothetical protein